MIFNNISIFYFRFFTFFCVVATGIISPFGVTGWAQSINTTAQFAYVLDPQTDTALLDVEANKRMYPASMTKIMTAYVGFRQIKEGILRLDDPVMISKKAHKMGGSKMFIAEGKNVSVDDLLHGIIIQSGNDASVALAEHIAGDEANFALIMNDVAQELGMTGTHYVNASGWPDENHYTTAKDLATLSERMIEEFPDFYRIFSQKTFTLSGITQKNRNGLIGANGVDGIKTGHTVASGYGQVSSAVIDGRRIIVVINGLDSANKRAAESARLMNWAFRSTATVNPYTTEEIVGEIPIWYGETPKIPLKIQQDISITIDRAQFKKLKYTITYTAPIKAPIEAGENIAQLNIHTETDVLHRIPLVAAKSIDSKGFMDHFNGNMAYLLWGKTP